MEIILNYVHFFSMWTIFEFVKQIMKMGTFFNSRTCFENMNIFEILIFFKQEHFFKIVKKIENANMFWNFQNKKNQNTNNFQYVENSNIF